MSQRVFYIVHLDKARIASLIVIISGLLLTAFATGYRTGNAEDLAPNSSQSVTFQEPNQDIFSIDESIAPSTETDHHSKLNTEIEDLPSNETSSVDLLASKGVDTQPKQRVNLLDSAIDDTISDRKLDLASSEKKLKDSPKVGPTTTKKKTTTKEPAKKEIAQKTTKKKKVTIKETKKTTPTTITKTEAKPEIFVLQMGAYQSREAALRLSEQIRKHGIQTYVRKTGNVHTVRTEAASNRQQLFQTEKKLKSLHFSPITVMLKANN